MKTPSKKIEITTFDWAIEIVTGSIIILGLIYVALNFTKLPDTIPTHFGIDGKPDGYGSKYMSLLLVFIGLSTYLMLVLSTKWPNLINYPFEITPETENAHYKNAFLMVRVLNLEITVLFGSIVFGTFQTATGQTNGLGYLTLIVTVFLLLTLALFVYNGYRIKKHFA
jgi:uncharacterized membrane protein